MEWLTLPLAPAPREVRIAELAFAADARMLLDARLDRLPWLRNAQGVLADQIRNHLYGPLDGVVDFLERSLRLVADALGLKASIVRSSSLAIAPSLKGQERVMAIVEALGGREYVNAPGGRAIYDPAAFLRRNLELHFLAPYRGPNACMLNALVETDPSELRDDILRSSFFEP
jgi:hypothetical protein